MILEALSSIADQPHPPMCVIVIDDGSSDELARTLLHAPIPIQLVKQAHSGQAVALNAGLALARAPLVTFLDHDDLWISDRSQVLIGEMEAQVDAVVGGVINRYVRPDGSLDDFYMGASRLLGSSVFRRNSLERVGPFVSDRRAHTNIDWWSRAMTSGLRTKLIDEPVLIRRIHGSNEGLRAESQTGVDLVARVRQHLARHGPS